MHLPVRLDRTIAMRLHARARADRWDVPVEVFQSALESSAARGLAGPAPASAAIDRYVSSLHLEDLALACACAAGHEEAWNHFVREFRSVLYRAASAIDSTGGARDLADSLYADLFGVDAAGGPRRSLFRYFHGRSSLSTWLRAVLSQRLVDRVRASRRLEALPEDDALERPTASDGNSWSAQTRFLEIVRQVIALVVSALAPRDRLRLASYYAHDLTLAEIGRVTGEHEATVSRQLARTRRAIREDVERQLRESHGLSQAAIAEGFASLMDDAGSLDLAELLGSDAARDKGAGPADTPVRRRGRKNPAPERSI